MACPENCKQFSVIHRASINPPSPHSWGNFIVVWQGPVFSPFPSPHRPLRGLPPLHPYLFFNRPFALLGSIKRSYLLWGEIRARGQNLHVPCFARSQKHGFCLTPCPLCGPSSNTAFFVQGLRKCYAPLTKNSCLMFCNCGLRKAHFHT